jgi:hypothetical protein
VRRSPACCSSFFRRDRTRTHPSVVSSLRYIMSPLPIYLFGHVYKYMFIIIIIIISSYMSPCPRTSKVRQPIAHKFFNFGPMVNFPGISWLRRETAPEAISTAFRTDPEGTFVSVDLTPRPAARSPDWPRGRSFGASHLPSSLYPHLTDCPQLPLLRPPPTTAQPHPSSRNETRNTHAPP